MARDGVFISYRRADSAEAVGRLTDDLRAYFGREHVYRDLDSNRSGQDYLVQIDEALDRSRVALAVIGPDWLTASGPDGRQRLTDPEDPVRQELEHALSSDTQVVLVLVGGAMPPARRTLPPSLAAIETIHACPMRDGDWHYDLGRLFESLEAHGVVPRPDHPEAVPVDVRRALAKSKRYERTMQASRRRTYDALAGTLQLLGYRGADSSAEQARVSFVTKRRQVQVNVIDGDRPGTARVVVEFDTIRGAVVGAGAVALSFVSGGAGGFIAWGALRAWERHFAVGFLDNVQSVLEGRGIQEDSSLPPGVHRWRSRRREV